MVKIGDTGCAIEWPFGPNSRLSSRFKVSSVFVQLLSVADPKDTDKKTNIIVRRQARSQGGQGEHCPPLPGKIICPPENFFKNSICDAFYIK